jgi:hypothetical protein
MILPADPPAPKETGGRKLGGVAGSDAGTQRMQLRLQFRRLLQPGFSVSDDAWFHHSTVKMETPGAVS